MIEVANEAVDLTPLELTDAKEAAALSATFGWPHRGEDWALMLRLGQGLKVVRGGQLQGTIIWWSLGADITTIGMVMVPKALQGQGIGTQLMQAAMAANTGRSMRLNATPDGMALYRRSGFREVGVICQSQGIAKASEGLQSACFAGRYVETQIFAFDQAMTGLARAELLSTLVTISDIAVVTDASGEMLGYALCRAFGHGRVIGPVVAEDEETAKALISLFLTRYAGQFLRIDTPQTHSLSRWLADHGLMEVEPATAMRLGPDDGTQPFALASQALG